MYLIVFDDDDDNVREGLSCIYRLVQERSHFTVDLEILPPGLSLPTLFFLYSVHCGISPRRSLLNCDNFHFSGCNVINNIFYRNVKGTRMEFEGWTWDVKTPLLSDEGSWLSEAVPDDDDVGESFALLRGIIPIRSLQ